MPGPSPALASLLLEQFDGSDGHLASAIRCFTRGLAEEDPGRKNMLLDIATKELSRLELIGSIVTMLHAGQKTILLKPRLKRPSFTGLLRRGSSRHTKSILYGGGQAPTRRSGVPATQP